MPKSFLSEAKPLRILHVLRAPVGGLFRHVRDLAAAQRECGHQVAVLCDKGTGDALTEDRLAALEQFTSLGIYRTRMARQISGADAGAVRETRRLVRMLDIDIIHGHGAKGGAYARMAAVGRGLRPDKRLAVFYTPHGGSLHYAPRSPQGIVFLGLERSLLRMTDGLIFESQFSADCFASRIGTGRIEARVIPNGLLASEFHDHSPRPDAADFLFVGELRHLKGVATLLKAMRMLSLNAMLEPEADAPPVARMSPPSLMIVGAGPDEQAFRDQVALFGLSDQVHFAGPMPVAQAFPLGRCLVVPSLAESFPYIVLEAAAARMPLLATDVGGIPEMTRGTSRKLLPPGNAAALAEAMARQVQSPENAAKCAAELQAAVQSRFTVEGMSNAILDFYVVKLAQRIVRKSIIGRVRAARNRPALASPSSTQARSSSQVGEH